MLVEETEVLDRIPIEKPESMQSGDRRRQPVTEPDGDTTDDEG